MSDSTTPETPTPAATTPNPGDTDSTPRELRAQIEAANRRAREATEKLAATERLAKEASDARDALQTRLTEREQAEMAEIDRLKAQLTDRDAKVAQLEPIRDEHGRYASAFEGMYKAELDALPEDKREVISSLSATGAWPDRLESLRKAKGLLPSAPPPPPTQAGTVTQPPGGVPTQPGAPTPSKLDPKNPPQWGQVLTPIGGGKAPV